jgi:hypothetical protein
MLELNISVGRSLVETGSAQQLGHAFEQIRGPEEKVEGWDSSWYEVLDAMTVAVPLG